jgi:cation diffusion facilitator family transporter
MEESVDREKAIKKVLFVTLMLNLLVALTKVIVGHKFSYFSLTSSGLESFFDGSSNILALVSIHYASAPPDEDHQFGHSKYETLGSLIIALFLFYAAIQISFDLFQVFKNDEVRTPQFGIIPVISILFSMGVSLFVTKYERKKGEELKSPILLADAEHTYGDFIVSFGVLIGIILSYYQFKWPDLIIGLFVCLYLFYLAVKIIRANLPDLLDASPVIDTSAIKRVEDIPGIVDIHSFRARGNKNYIQIDFHLHLDAMLTLKAAHMKGKEAEKIIRELFQKEALILDVLVHIEPHDEDHKKL